MSGYAILIRHKTKPGARAAVQEIWRRHMRPAIEQNPGHQVYVYAFEQDPNRLCALQIYSDAGEANAFLERPAYKAYEAEVSVLLEGPPNVEILDVQWMKGGLP